MTLSIVAIGFEEGSYAQGVSILTTFGGSVVNASYAEQANDSLLAVLSTSGLGSTATISLDFHIPFGGRFIFDGACVGSNICSIEIDGSLTNAVGSFSKIHSYQIPPGTAMWQLSYNGTFNDYRYIAIILKSQAHLSFSLDIDACYVA